MFQELLDIKVLDWVAPTRPWIQFPGQNQVRMEVSSVWRRRLFYFVQFKSYKYEYLWSNYRNKYNFIFKAGSNSLAHDWITNLPPSFGISVLSSCGSTGFEKSLRVLWTPWFCKKPFFPVYSCPGCIGHVLQWQQILSPISLLPNLLLQTYSGKVPS